jgi:hypothetical protein
MPDLFDGHCQKMSHLTRCAQAFGEKIASDVPEVADALRIGPITTAQTSVSLRIMRHKLVDLCSI